MKKKKLPNAISRTAEAAAEAVIQAAPEPEHQTTTQGQATSCEMQTATVELQPRSADIEHARQVAASEKATASPALTISEKDRHEALKLVERFAFWAGAAGAIPVPGLDLAGVGAVQVQMVRRLAEMLDVEFSQSRGKAVIAAIGGAVITGSSGMGAASLTKTIPVLGTAVSSIAVPTLAAGATYAIGIAFIEHFASGGTLLNFDLQRARAALRKK